MVAVTWTSAPGAPTHGVPLERGLGYVAVEWAGIVVVGVYVSPNCGAAAFDEFLDGVGIIDSNIIIGIKTYFNKVEVSRWLVSILVIIR
jgi:hypothetical protein